MAVDTPASGRNLTTRFRDRLTNALHTALQTRTNTLIVAPTSLGKTHQVATTRWGSLPDVVGTPVNRGIPLIHVSPSREARDQAYEMSRRHGVKAHKLEGREDACPVAAGKFDEYLRVPREGQRPSDWFSLKCDVQGVPFSAAHDELEDRLGGLPCSKGSSCRGATQWIPILEGSADEFDVIHVTDTFVYNSSLIRDRHVIFDEQPTYIKRVQKYVTERHQIGRILTHEDVRTGITRFLKTHAQDGNYNDWEGLVSVVHAQHEEGLESFREIVDKAEFDRSWYLNNQHVHTSTPVLIKAITNARQVGNGYLRGEAKVLPNGEWFESDRIGNPLTRTITVVIDRNNDIKLIHEPPNLSLTRSIVGFDAHPTERLWKVNTVSDLRVDDLGLTEDELREWRRTERGLTVYQVGNYTRQYTRGWAGDTPTERDRTRRRANALIRAVRQEHGGSFRTAITAKATKKDVEQMMKDAGIANPDVLHYGEVRSRGDFEDETVGLLLGCIDPGDHNILTTLALLGLYAEPAMMETANGGLVREPGRAFVGPGAEAATEILEDVREMNVAQAIGRYARNANNPASNATVYVWTDAILPELRDRVVPGVKNVLIGKQKAIVDHVMRSQEWLTAREIHAGVLATGEFEGLSKEHVRKTMNELTARGVARIQKGTGWYGADEYWIDPNAGTDVVDLTPGHEVSN